MKQFGHVRMILVQTSDGSWHVATTHDGTATTDAHWHPRFGPSATLFDGTLLQIYLKRVKDGRGGNIVNCATIFSN